MAKVIVPRPGLVPAGVYPAGIEERQVGLLLSVERGLGLSSFVYSPAMSERLRVKGIDAYLFGSTPADNIGGFIYISAGSGRPTSGGVIALEWKMLVPVLAGGSNRIYWFGKDMHFEWDMNLFLTGQPWRFGVTVENGFDFRWYGLFYFRISEV